MKIGLVSPFQPGEIKDLLDGRSKKFLKEIKGQVATPVMPLVREWLGNGHQLAVFCLDPCASKPHKLTGKNLTVYVFPKRRARYCMVDFYRKERSQIKNAILFESPDVLNAQWSYEHALAALDTGIPTMVTCHDTPLRYAWISKSLFMTYHLLVAALVIRKAQHLVCVSPYTAKHIKFLFRPKCPIAVIPNGLPKGILEHEIKQTKHISNHLHRPYTICSVGGWGNLKNIKALLRAYGRIKKTTIPTRLVLFGRDLGPGQDAESWALKNNLCDGVEFMGPTKHDDIMDFMKSDADLMMHPSKIETHGMVLIEAMACGVPVIGGSKSGAVPWTLDYGKTGILCDIYNISSIADSIDYAMRHPDEMHLLAERAWAHVNENFKIEDTAKKNEDILSSIMERNLN